MKSERRRSPANNNSHPSPEERERERNIRLCLGVRSLHTNRKREREKFKEDDFRIQGTCSAREQCKGKERKEKIPFCFFFFFFPFYLINYLFYYRVICLQKFFKISNRNVAGYDWSTLNCIFFLENLRGWIFEGGRWIRFLPEANQILTRL